MQNQSSLKKHRGILTIFIIIIILLAALGYYSQQSKVADQPPTTQNTQQTMPGQTLLPTPKTISSFSLTDDVGNAFTNDNLKGHWTLMFFGFTRCGDICPITLTELNKMYQQLQKDLPYHLPQVVFVSVDPQRDTQAILHSYIKSYNPNFIGATGNDDNLKVFIEDLGVYFQKKPGVDENTYGIGHSSQIYLFNPKGNWVSILTYPQQAEQLAENYKFLINSKPEEV